jgi:peptidyl-prolyl cis-trans isomerase C
VKRDISIALAAILIVLGASFAVAKMRPDKPLTPSQPFVPNQGGALAAKKQVAATEKIVMRVNGEPVTEREFASFMTAVPEQQRAMFASPEGKKLLAQEVVRMKALEQEGIRLGIANDPQLTAQFDLLRAQILAQRALEKIVNEKAESKIAAEYEKVKNETKTLRHIVVGGFEGAMIPPRDRKPLTPDAAMAKANAIIAKLRGGADFGQIARTESDDLETAGKGGTLGPLAPGQLPPEVEAVVSKLQLGQVSEPVRTQLGLHIFSLGTPTLEELRPMLLQRVQQQVAQEEVKRLEAAAKVDYDPTYFPPSQSAPRMPPSMPAPRSNG